MNRPAAHLVIFVSGVTYTVSVIYFRGRNCVLPVFAGFFELFSCVVCAAIIEVTPRIKDTERCVKYRNFILLYIVQNNRLSILILCFM